MIIITRDSIAKYAFDNGANIVRTESKIFTPDFIIGDLNESNSDIYFTIENVPNDFTGDKYLFDGASFTLNPDYIN